MSILNFLPEFKVVEINRSTGLVAGHVLAQYPLDAGFTGIKTIPAGNGSNYLENGFILGLSHSLELEAYDSEEHAQPMLVFTEELNTFFDGLKWYATLEDQDDFEIYPRVIGLYVGDTFTTNNYDENSVDLDDMTHATVVDGVLTLQTGTPGASGIFAVEKSTLPAGEPAVRFTYVGHPVTSE